MPRKWTDAERIADAQRWEAGQQRKREAKAVRERRRLLKLAAKRAQAERARKQAQKLAVARAKAEKARQKADIKISRLHSRERVSQAKADARRAAERKHKASSALYHARYERIGAAVSPLTGAVRRTGKGVSKVVKQVQKQQKRKRPTAQPKKKEQSLHDFIFG